MKLKFLIVALLICIVQVSNAQYLLQPEDVDFDQSTGTISDYLNTVEKDIEIPSEINDVMVTSIGNRAFYNNQLTSVTIPNSVTYIGSDAFAYNALTSVTMESSRPLIISANVFDENDLSTATLCVPEGAREAYSEALVWQDFGTIVEKTVTGVEDEIAYRSLKSYPNPATDLIHVSSGEYMIYSKSGSMVDFGLSDGTVDVSKLVRGVYFVKTGGLMSEVIIE